MTDSAIDPFELIRRELLLATSRDMRSRVRRHRAARLVLVMVVSLALLTGIAAAASERVASTIRTATGSLRDVVANSEKTVTPDRSRDRAPGAPLTSVIEQLQFHDDLMNGVNPEERGDAPLTVGNAKLLLDEEVDGFKVQIAAFERPAGSPTLHGSSKQTETCYAVLPGGTTCTSAFNPGLPINYGTSWEVGRGSIKAVLAGITASSVERVQFVTKDGVEQATMGDHAFWWKSSKSLPVAIEVVLKDGSKRSRAIERPAQLCTSVPEQCD
ncbi:MAG: hypothetical protein JWM90_2122 [Thermoleophilia bacterium]|nr:hypothetical protein [Thermoleophilia bacterium]